MPNEIDRLLYALERVFEPITVCKVGRRETLG
jgi:hypothetical protein